MKYLIFVLFIFSISSCHEKAAQPDKRGAEIKMLNDSVSHLMSAFLLKGDSSALPLMLSLNDRVLSIETSKTSRFYELNTKIQILTFLKRKKEAFLLMEKTLNKDPNNIQRLIYFGKKHELMGQQDSSLFYYNKALVACDKVLKKNAEIAIRKAEIYYFYLHKKAEGKIIIDEALKRNPDNEILKDFHENIDMYCKTSEDFFSGWKL